MNNNQTAELSGPELMKAAKKAHNFAAGHYNRLCDMGANRTEGQACVMKAIMGLLGVTDCLINIIEGNVVIDVNEEEPCQDE